MKTILWESTWSRALEHVVITEGAADGVIIGLDEARSAFRINYEIEWDDGWCTREVEIDVALNESVRSFHLSVDEHGRWFDGDGSELSELAGCFDVDIWPTPFTNTLAIRRLELAVGEREVITVVWVNALAGELKPMRQAYTRLEQDSYRYENLESGFTAELLVDEEGLVIEYPGLFSRAR